MKKTSILIFTVLAWFSTCFSTEPYTPITVRIDRSYPIELKGVIPFKVEILPKDVATVKIKNNFCQINPQKIGKFIVKISHKKGSYQINNCEVTPLYWITVVGEKGLILQSQNNGDTWKNICYKDVQTDFTSVNHVSALHILAAGWNQDIAPVGCAILLSRNGGLTWQKTEIHGIVKEDNLLKINTLHMVNAKSGFAGTQDGLVLKTENGGSSWKAINPEHVEVFGVIKKLKFFTSWEGLVLTQHNGLWKTKDGGKLWDMLYNSANLASDLQTLGRQFIAVADDRNNGMIHLSVDKGMHWEKIPFSDGKKERGLRTMHFFDNQNIVATSNSSVFYSKDGGKSWHTSQCGEKTDFTQSMIFPLKGMGFMVCPGATTYNKLKIYNSPYILYSMDIGRTWEAIIINAESDLTPKIKNLDVFIFRTRKQLDDLVQF
ncbi:MAG: hypothetical protein AB1633_12575 [Elusimicrobiota bacterium]